MKNFLNVEGGIELQLVSFDKFNANIPATDVPSGPLVSMSDLKEQGSQSYYTVTILAYLPSGKVFNDVNEGKMNGVSLLGNKIYLNYYGVTVATSLDRNENRELSQCRDFRIEYNCEEGAKEFDVFYLQFNYSLDRGTLSADAVLVREVNDDPDTDRGTRTTPATSEQ